MSKSRKSLKRRTVLKNRTKRSQRNQVYTLNKKGKILVDIMTGKEKSNSLSPQMARSMLYISKQRVRPSFLKLVDLNKYYHGDVIQIANLKAFNEKTFGKSI